MEPNYIVLQLILTTPSEIVKLVHEVHTSPHKPGKLRLLCMVKQ